MASPFKAMIIGYFLPLLAAIMVVFIPEYSSTSLLWIIVIFAILLTMPILLSIRFPNNREKAYILTLTFQMYAFVFFFAFPLLKVVKEHMGIQLLLIGIFVSMYFLARIDQRTEIPIVFPDSDKVKWIAFPFYVIPFLLAILGVGGNISATRVLFDYFGTTTMMPYFSTIIYLFGCWLMFLFSSLAYKSHVKEGYLEK
ncbi:hypothetical protein H9649_09200 [Sporosarcina sp. Sa2YVA2]|uniref:Uncharacterized protein n=1 Tax=Sporosarcina quadrami TaxID=2762234 RepID=A0ABR8U9P0_9BACL|nr:hypothetical protein [Sporosarcina quadrami]MBD7984757.1 hypothetical protein [Sporosarcina quadrami]